MPRVTDLGQKDADHRRLRRTLVRVMTVQILTLLLLLLLQLRYGG